jgi:hypothetical protein
MRAITLTMKLIVEDNSIRRFWGVTVKAAGTIFRVFFDMKY